MNELLFQRLSRRCSLFMKGTPMRLGFALPQIGPVDGPDALVTVAQRALQATANSLRSLSLAE